ncbi:MAG: hypothetical protein QJR07_02345 [Acetobacteraceae bacterium]|nr:hypothetical protein [Acetobacteraceae bacterium]
MPCILRVALMGLVLLVGAGCGLQPASDPPRYGNFKSGGNA